MDVITLRDSPAPSAVFVYGTLMAGQRRHNLLQSCGLRSVTPASAGGSLVDLGEYPALRRSPQCASRVYGECIEVEHLEDLLECLDEYEGPRYRREVVEITLEDGRSRDAWAYVLASDPADFELINSGRWRP
jgi:gamma-glutamylaminecyclotransferase